MKYLLSAMLLVVGVIHVIPVTGVIGSDRLAALYGFAVDDPNLEIVMRHRAVLFALLGALLIGAAFNRAWQGLAIVAGFVSVTSFLAIAWQVGGYNEQIGRVFTADLVALACLVVATVVWFSEKKVERR